MKLNLMNALIVFGIVFVVSSILGNLLYMNPLVAGIYERMKGHPGMKDWQSFGSIGRFIALNMLAGLLICAIYLVAFTLMRARLPGNPFAAGAIFALVIILVKAAPEAFNQFLNINYPSKLILTQFINSSIGIAIDGIVLSLAYARWPAAS